RAAQAGVQSYVLSMLMKLRLAILILLVGLGCGPLKQDASSALARTATPNSSDTDYTAHIEQLKKKLPSGAFTIVVQPPFSVTGAEAADVVKEHSLRTVKWAVDKLKLDYFSADPKEILDIWLFKDASSYQRNARALFGDKPTTPYGYYSSA